jgi:hypothetical protein
MEIEKAGEAYEWAGKPAKPAAVPAAVPAVHAPAKEGHGAHHE